MANQFYVQPASVMPGLSSAMTGIRSGAEAKLESAREERKQSKLQEASTLMGEGKLDELSTLMVENPWIRDNIDKTMNWKNEQTKQNAIESAKDILIKGVQPAQALTNRAEFVINQGGDASGTIQLAQQAQQNPQVAIDEAEKVLALYDPAALKAYRSQQGRDPEKTTPATDIDDYVSDAQAQYLLDNPDKKSMPPGERNRARREFKRVQAKEAAGVRTAVTSAELTARAKLEPAVRTAVDQAASSVKTQVDAAEGKRSNDLAWNVYDAGMRNLVNALSGTTTGPGMDWVPALTSNAQTANGAVAAMAPVLKQMFRASGEGVFTDRDQEMLVAMMPTRNDHPEARDAKIRGVNDIVRAKLGMGGAQSTPQQAPPPSPQQGQLPPGITEEDIATTMQVNNMTREQVLARLRGQ